MLCQICREKPATVHIQEIVNGEKRTLHFCAQCAEKKSMLDPLFKDFDLPGILKEIMAQAGDPAVPKSSAKNTDRTPEKVICPVCGWDSIRWKKYGRFGCPACYDAFAELLNRELVHTQHGLHHTGKTVDAVPDEGRKTTKKAVVPVIGEASEDSKKTAAPRRRVSARIRQQQELERMKNDLKESVIREEFELAAELRDKIAALEARLAKMKGTQA